jgi:exosortase
MPLMNPPRASAVTVESTMPDSVKWARVLTLAFFFVLWLEVIQQLRADWSLNPQYGYGWTVPFLAVYLFWKRWQTRPVPVAPASRIVPVLLMALGVMFVLPIRFVAVANPDWRLLSWCLALVAVAVSLLWLFETGGSGWVRHFMFPVVFFLVAVPWPVRFEQYVIQDLMRAVTAINVFFLHLLGVPALKHGNVIEVGSGLIGIEEACSGVRSLQATLMISLFLGELYSFRISKRVFLVLVGALLAFVCNVARTAILVSVGTNRGESGIAKWHDPAGLTILLLCLFGLWVVSLIIQHRSGLSFTPPADLSGYKESILPSPALLLPLLICLILTEIGVRGWYQFHQSPVVTSRWTVEWPTSERDYQTVEIPSEAETLLHFNDGGGARWQTSNGSRWTMYFFKWLPGQTAARFLKVHRPDICLPASGMTMERDSGLRLLSVGGINLPIRSYRFDDRGTPLHVFYCYWDARSSYENATTAQAEDWSARGRLREALQGHRDIGAQMLELVVWGYQNDAQAESALRAELARLIRVINRT